jgi:hypothetical protein
MSRLALASFFLIAACLPGTLKADDADPIRAELTKAKKAHAEDEARARAALLGAIDDAVKVVAGTGDLEGVKAMQAEKKAFQDSGKLPSSARLRTAAAEYQKATRTADAVLEKVYDKAMKDATKALKIDLAEAIQAELKEITAKGPNPKTAASKGEAPATRPKLIPGRWEVTYTPNRSTHVYIIRSDGAVVNERGEVQYQIKHRDGALIVEFPDNKLERFTFAENRLFVEHFNPKSDYERNIPDQVGIGTLSKKK